MSVRLPGPKLATILLVEDHDDSRDAFGQILGSLGHRVLLAANGREALDLVERGRPDLRFCDLRMPGMDGFQFMAALAARGMLSGLTVLAVTAPSPTRQPRLACARPASPAPSPSRWTTMRSSGSWTGLSGRSRLWPAARPGGELASVVAVRRRFDSRRHAP
jgi:CheY-like chemotaxis protein